MTAAQARARFVAQAQQYIGIRESSGARRGARPLSVPWRSSAA